MSQVRSIVKFYVYISSTWVELVDAVAADGGRGSWGISDNSPVSMVADVGELTIALNNSTGQYTPGGPSALAGWKKGLPVKMVISTDYDTDKTWYYYIKDIPRPKSNNKEKKIVIHLVTWLDYASRHPIVNPGIQTNQRGDQVMQTVVNLIEVDPRDTDFQTGTEIFPTSFDAVTSQTKAYNEFAKTALSELGRVYERKDGTLVFEASSYRNGWRAVDTISTTVPDLINTYYAINEDGNQVINEDGTIVINDTTLTYTFNGQVDESFIMDFEAPYGDKIINRMTCYVQPRRLSTSAEVLFSLPSSAPIPIGSGQTVTIKGTYANPSGGLPINGKDMVTPAATTDYLVNTLSTGLGTNITASLALVSITYGTEGFTHLVRNDSTATGYITKYNCRGTGVYKDNPIEHAATNSASIAEFEAQSESINQAYKNDLASGALFCDTVVLDNNQPRIVLNSISFCANKSYSAMLAFLNYDVSDMIYVSIDEIGIEGNYYIQGVEFTFTKGLIMVKWILAVALSLQYGLSPIAVEFAGTTATDAISYGRVPRVTNLTQKTFSAFVYTDAYSVAGDGDTLYAIGSSDSGGEILYLSSSNKVVFIRTFSTTNGVWTTNADALPLSAWAHIAVTYDSAATTNKPIIYINGTSVTVTEFTTPVGTAADQTGNAFDLGNSSSLSAKYGGCFNGKMFDPRIYNRILSSAEITTLYNAGSPDVSLVTDGLVFQGFNVRTADLANYVDQTLTSVLKVRDNMYGVVGTPNGSPTGRAEP